MTPNVRCTCQSGRHQVVRRLPTYHIQLNAARVTGALQVNSRR